jgi:hypothetical protein
MDLHVDVNECFVYGCGYTIYYANLLCMFRNFSCAGCILFIQKNQANLRQLGLDHSRLVCVIYEDQLGRRRLVCVIYEGQLGRRRLTCVIYDGPTQSS